MSAPNLTRRAAIIAAATVPAMPAHAAADAVAPLVAKLFAVEAERSAVHGVLDQAEADSGYNEVSLRRHLYAFVRVKGVRSDWDIGGAEIDQREASGDITAEAAADARERYAAKLEEIAEAREVYGLKALDDQMAALGERIEELRTAIVETEAHTLADLRAKAEVVADLSEAVDQAEDGDLTAQVLMSLVEDLRRMAGGAA